MGHKKCNYPPDCSAFSPLRNENLSFKNRPWNANCSENKTSCCVRHSCWLGRRFFLLPRFLSRTPLHSFLSEFLSCFPFSPPTSPSPSLSLSPLCLFFFVFFFFFFHFFPHSLSPLLCLLAAVCDAYYGVMLGHHATHTHTHTHTLPRGVSACYSDNAADETNNRQIYKNGLKFRLILGDFHISAALIKPRV